MSEFRKRFYRFLDSLEDCEDANRFREIEFKTFKILKPKIEADLGKWKGDLKQNEEADNRIATAIVTSFKSYEVNRKEYEEAYFVF